jgi:hypothetical protein
MAQGVLDILEIMDLEVLHHLLTEKVEMVAEVVAKLVL